MSCHQFNIKSNSEVDGVRILIIFKNVGYHIDKIETSGPISIITLNLN